MPNAQEWLQQNYPNKEKVREIIHFSDLTGKLTIADFPQLYEINVIDYQLTQLHLKNCPQLKHLVCRTNALTELTITNCPNLQEISASENQLTSLDLNNLPNLEKVSCWRSKITANLNIFSHLTKLKTLDLGIDDKMKKTNPNRNNNFSGSLKALENCKDLEYLCIGYQPNIKGGLEYLPAEKLTYFGCDGTEFKEMSKPFNYDIKAWQLASPELKAKHKEVAEKEKLIEELSKKIKESAKKLEKAKESEEDKTQKIARLESQIQILTKNKEKLATEIAKEKTDHQQTKPNHQSQLKDLTTILFPSNSCNSFANFAFADLKKQASQIIQENQQARVKISELESQISNLNQQLYSIQQQTAISQGENLKTAMEKETNSNRLANENYWDKQIQDLTDDKLPDDKKTITLQTRRRNHYNQLVKSANQTTQLVAQMQIAPK